MDFSDQQVERYARHILLDQIGGTGQAKLLASRVLVVGAGGLGSPLVLYLAAAGVGALGVVDDDVVDLSNLQRQIAHTTDRIGMPKVESARAAVAAINPEVEVIAHRQRLTAANALELVSRYDIVADGSDNFPTRFLVNDACFFAAKPLVSAAILRFDGQLATFKAYERRGNRARPMLPLPLRRAATGGPDPELRRGGRARRLLRRARRAAGDRGDQGTARHRRQPFRLVAGRRCTLRHVATHSGSA